MRSRACTPAHGTQLVQTASGLLYASVPCAAVRCAWQGHDAKLCQLRAISTRSFRNAQPSMHACAWRVRTTNDLTHARFFARHDLPEFSAMRSRACAAAHIVETRSDLIHASFLPCAAAHARLRVARRTRTRVHCHAQHCVHGCAWHDNRADPRAI